MTLTTEQRDAVIHGDAVPVMIEGTLCVVLRHDIYERVKRLVDDEMPAEEGYAAMLEAWDAVGSPQDAEDYKS